jgi:hypothetical protein
MKGLAVAGLLALGVGSAAAATGSLPDAAQDGVANAAEHVGITLPAGHDNHPTKDNHPGGKPADTPPTSADPADAAAHAVDESETPPSTDANHGSLVSDVARNTDATGRDKGAAVSDVARGDHGPSGDAQTSGPTTPTTGQAPVATPNAGGIGTGGDASDSANASGTGHASPNASAGSGNAGDHPNRP